MKKILGLSFGNCVHVAGVLHFLNLAEQEGFETIFIGPAIPVMKVLDAIQEHQPDYVAIGYRLTPENVIPLVKELKEKVEKLDKKPIFIFGGTKPVAKAVESFQFFEMIYDGTEDIDDCIQYLRGKEKGVTEVSYADDLIKRMEMKQPYPLLRHHFGLPSYEDTAQGIQKIAESKVLDIISIGPDQNTQQFFFRQEERNVKLDGAGGVPIHTKDEFIRLKEASKCGNFPLMRCYSGTADVIKMAGLLKETINNAWCAVPLCWYNEIDGRGTRTIEESIQEAHELMKWHGERNIPLEVNEPHHWGLRDAHDTISVVMAYLSAYHAKHCGVKEYIAQYMFNVPNSLSFSMDLAKNLAMIELVESLQSDSFKIFRQVRAGLPFLSSDTDIAKGQLAASTYLSMSLRPHIIHVVGYSEAEHAATPKVVIESCKIVRGVVRSILEGGVSYQNDEVVMQRKNQLMNEAKYVLQYIEKTFEDVKDPLSNPLVIAKCVRKGIIDAPHILKSNGYEGSLKTRMIDGKCLAIHPITNLPMLEKERLELLEKGTQHETR